MAVGADCEAAFVCGLDELVLAGLLEAAGAAEVESGAAYSATTIVSGPLL